MQFEANNIYHIYNRGNNSQKIFFDSENYVFFLKKLRTHILPHADVLAWCLMSSHFHLMIYLKNIEIKIEETSGDNKDKFGVKWGTCVKKQRDFNQSIAIMLRSYTRAINNQKNRTGSLFQMKTKAKCLTDNSEISPAWFETSFGSLINIEDADKSYPQICFNYIHQNPVTAKLVQSPEEWEFSSYRDFTGIRNGTLVSKGRVQEFGLKWF